MASPEPLLAETRSVLLLGFSAFERDALAAGFRLAAATRQPAYRLVAALAQAELVVVDAEQPAAHDALRRAGRLHDAVIVGAWAPAGAGGWTMRPIDPLHVLRALDQLAARAGADREPPPAAWAPSAAPGAGTAPAPASALRRRDDDADGPDGAAVRAAQPVAPPLPLPPPAQSADLLLVDGGALHGLDRLLRGLGLRTRRIAGGSQASERVAEAPWAIVFVDADGAFDALALCRALRQGAAPAPAVVLVAAEVSDSDRVRGALAGCAAWLGNPPALAELHATLWRHGVRLAPLAGSRRRP